MMGGELGSIIQEYKKIVGDGRGISGTIDSFFSREKVEVIDATMAQWLQKLDNYSAKSLDERVELINFSLDSMEKHVDSPTILETFIRIVRKNLSISIFDPWVV